MPKHLPDLNTPVALINDTLDSERVRALAAQHGISEDFDLYGALTNAASWYHLLTATKETRLTHARHKAYLDEVGKRAEALKDALKGMNAQLAFELQYVWPHPPSTDRWRSRMEDDARNLAHAARRAVRSMPNSKGGAPADVAFHKLLDSLIDMYEQSTGKEAGYWHKETWFDPWYGADAGNSDSADGSDGTNELPYRGPFVEFVSEALGLIGVEKPNTALGKALERRLKKRRAGSKSYTSGSWS